MRSAADASKAWERAAQGKAGNYSTELTERMAVSAYLQGTITAEMLDDAIGYEGTFREP